MATEPGGDSENYYAILDQRNKRKRTSNQNNLYDFPSLQKPNKQPNKSKAECQKFLIIKNCDKSKPLQSFNIFLIAKALESITTDNPEKISFTREGNLMILTKNQTQTTRFLKATQLSNLCKINVELHPTLNISKGVVHCPALTNLTGAEIVDGLRSQNVTDCHKITKIQDGKVINTPLHVLSFNNFNLPKEIVVAWEICKVEPYIPAPMQCKGCFRIGHTKKHCKSEAKCNVCASPIHEPTPCEKVECINCKQQHRSNNKNCPTYKKRQQIITHKTIHKCSFAEASKAVNEMIQPPLPVPVESLDEAIKQKNFQTNSQSSIQNSSSTSKTQQSNSYLPPNLYTPNPNAAKKVSSLLLSSENKTENETKTATSISSLPNISNHTETTLLELKNKIKNMQNNHSISITSQTQETQILNATENPSYQTTTIPTKIQIDKVNNGKNLFLDETDDEEMN